MVRADIVRRAAADAEVASMSQPSADALDLVERLHSEVDQCATELAAAASVLRPNYPGLAGLYDKAAARARSIG